MKKFLLLPLLALMFVGCSKDALTEKTPELATAQTAKNSDAIRVSIDIREFYTDRWGIGNNKYPVVTYLDENGEQKQLELREGQGNNEIVVTSSTMEVSGFEYRGEKEKAGISIRTNMIEGDPDGYRADYEGGPESLPYSIIIPVFRPMSADTYSVTITVKEWDEFL